jgi:predicted house-cleaning noncanonical NTP pyrophosphatase (MazG superfamily)
MKRIYNKLVRDRIPEIMQMEGFSSIECKTMDKSEFAKALALKVVEESKEIAEEARNGNRNGVLNEIVDVLEVIESLKNLFMISDEEIEKASEDKLVKKGGFVKQIWLESANDGR